MTKEDRLDAIYNKIYQTRMELDELREVYKETTKTYQSQIQARIDELDDLEEKLSNLEAG